MSTKDVLDQIRDLQSVIDEFAADGSKTGSNKPPSPIILQKPNEIEDETPARSNKTERLKREEKILIETKPELLLEKCNLNLSDDFSSLVEQFKQHLSPCTNTKFPKKDIDIFQHRKKELSVNTSQEKIQVEEQQTPSKQANVENNFLNPTTPITKNTRSRNNSHSSSKNTKKNNGIHSNNNNDSSTNLFNSIPTSSTSSPRSGKMSRRTSASSKKSQKSVKTTRQRSQRRHKHHQKQDKYVERSYDEMMRIPDIFERVSFYEKTLDLCLQVESPIANWIKKNSAKGLPKPLTEDYIPPTGSTSLESMASDSFSISSPFSGNIAPFLKKSGSQTTPRPTQPEPRPFMTPSAHTMQSLFGKSISRLNLSRSTQIPRYDPSENMRFAKTPKITRRNNRASHMEDTLAFKLTPKLPQSFTGQKMNTSKTKALNYMTNVLPQLDVDVLSAALDEANGDPMLAITLAVSQTKQKSKNEHFLTSHR